MHVTRMESVQNISLAILMIYINCWHDIKLASWRMGNLFYFQKVVLQLNLITFIENSIKDSANCLLWEWIKFTFQMINFFSQLVPSFYFSWEFCRVNQLVSIFILYIIIYESLACSFSWGYDAISTVICSIDKALTSS